MRVPRGRILLLGGGGAVSVGAAPAAAAGGAEAPAAKEEAPVSPAFQFRAFVLLLVCIGYQLLSNRDVHSSMS